MSRSRYIRRSAAILLTLAAPLVSISGALTTGLNGTSPAVRFPPGYGVTLAATVAATMLAAVLAALIARRDALVAIPVSLGIWAIAGLGVVAAGLQLGHTGLTHWGIILVAASLIGAAVGMIVAARRGQPGRPDHGPAATGSVQAGPGRPNGRDREAVMDRDDGDRLVIELPGGGSVGYAVFGDPDGVPCFAFHGTSSSRLVPGWMFPPGLLTAAGVRMIGVDRPAGELPAGDHGHGRRSAPVQPSVRLPPGGGGHHGPPVARRAGPEGSHHRRPPGGGQPSPVPGALRGRRPPDGLRSRRRHPYHPDRRL